MTETYKFGNGVVLRRREMLDLQVQRYTEPGNPNLHEPVEEEWLLKVLNSYDRTDPVFLDVGAAVGYYSILVKKKWPEATVIAVEPLPEHIEALHCNASLNSLQSQDTHKMLAFFECLIRVPLILWDPTGRVPRGVSSDLVQQMDAMATVLDLCGVPQPIGSRARSFLDTKCDRSEIFADAGILVQQPKAPIPDLRLKAAQPPTAFGPGAMLRTKDWKLTQYADDRGELYHIRDDPFELENRYEDPSCASIVSDMKSRLVQRMLCKGQAPEDLPEGAVSRA